MTTDTCQICGKPTRITSGKMEDFLELCVCGHDDVQAKTVTICKGCGKRIEKRRQGTITQYIFRYDNCSCDRPEPTVHTLDSGSSQKQTALTEDGIEEDGIELSADSFPVDRFRPLKELGKGTTGAVYLALDRFLSKKVAIKTLNRLDSKQLILFQNEAKATSRLSHPNIVSILDFGSTEAESPYMVLEYFADQSLKDYLEKHCPLNWYQLKQVLIGVCEALSYSHAQGIFHRDIKPSNVLVSDMDTDAIQVKLIDFGVAKLIDFYKTTEFQGKTLAGTPEYMSPDVASGLVFSDKSEIYSLGCLAFECLTGKPPFSADTAMEVISQHANNAAPALNQSGDLDIPKEAESLIMNILEKDPDTRPTLDEILESLKGTKVSDVSPQDTAIDSSVKKDISATPIVIVATLLTAVLVAVVINQIATSEDEFNKIEPTINRALDTIDSSKSDSYLNEFTGFPWEGGIVWHQKRFVTDEDLIAIDSNSNIQYLSLFAQKYFTDIGLRHVLKQGLKGIGLGTTKTGFRRIEMVASTSPDLDALLLSSCELKDADLTPLVNLKKLRLIDLSNNNIGSKGLYYVSKIKTLEALQIDNIAHLTNDGLDHISQLPKLRCLCIDENSIKDLKSWKKISELKGITLLSIGTTNLTDTALRLISSMKLKKLDVSENPITGNGLKIIGKMQSLDTLIFSGNQFHKADLVQLKKSLPGCKLILEHQLFHRDVNRLMIEEKSFAEKR